MGRVLNDVLWAIGAHSEAALVLLDMLSAFDTIDHTLLIDRQERSYGVGGTALFCFRSYLTERSEEYNVHFQDTPVWSASGLVIYFAPIKDVIRAHGMDCMLYTDDIQLYSVINSTFDRSAVIS